MPLHWDSDTVRHPSARSQNLPGGIERVGRTARSVTHVAQQEFSIGDRVTDTEQGWTGEVTSISDIYSEHRGTSAINMLVEFDDGGADRLGERKTAGWNENNWRRSGSDYADYEDNLDPTGNPKAMVEEADYGSFSAQVTDGAGNVLEQNDDVYSIEEGIAWASKVLQKTYKSDSRADPGQGKFFTTPGKGKLFGKTAEWVQENANNYTISGPGEYRAEIRNTSYRGNPWNWTVYRGHAVVGNDVEATVEEAQAEAEAVMNGLAASRTSGKHTASMWESMTEAKHVVAGWSWDERLSGFVAEGSSAHFACVCGSNVEAPGYVTCTCGKIWNSYPIQANGATRVICREIPVRDFMLAKKE